MFKIIELLATVGTVLGFFLVSAQILLVGFTISFTSQILWIIWARKAKAVGIIAVNCLLLISSANGIMQSFKGEQHENSSIEKAAAPQTYSCNYSRLPEILACFDIRQIDCEKFA